MPQFPLAAFIAFFAVPSDAAERWETLPPTPAPIATNRSGDAEANGIKIHYAIYGQGSPVIFLHGGLEYGAFVDQISKMWADQPNWTDEQLKAIEAPIVVVDGDHDEAIKRPHTE